MKLRVLFLCTHNSCRSQMAEGLLRSLYSGTYEVFSAGTDPSSVNAQTVKAMDELGIDISGQRSEHLQKYFDQPFDAVVTTCDSARETCPVFPSARRIIHHGFTDPSTIVGKSGDLETAFRSVRDEIKAWIRETFEPRSFGSR